MSNELPMFHYNGVDGESGGYLFHPEPVSHLGSPFFEKIDGNNWPEHVKNRGPIDAVNPALIEEAGWGVIFHYQANPKVKEALKPLLDLRREQAGPLFKKYDGETGYRPGETSSAFLRRIGAAPGPVDPTNAPYYLMIVGDPSKIPFSFQYNLDIQYAVGRISFDKPESYAAYASALVAHILKSPKRDHKCLVLFAPENQDDPPTRLSSQRLVSGLAHRVRKMNEIKTSLQTIQGEQATKRNLGSLFKEHDAPTLLVTAGHGVGYIPGHANQIQRQGGLVCQDWPGPKHSGVTGDLMYSADDIPDISLRGLICFFFACYSAGTPRYCNFRATRKIIAPDPFIAKLPQKILSQKQGAGLAVVGHVDRVFDTSFLWNSQKTQIQTFSNCIGRLLQGKPLGWAMEVFGLRYAELMTQLAEIKESKAMFPELYKESITSTLIAHAAHDTRNFVILGDPAVTLV